MPEPLILSCLDPNQVIEADVELKLAARHWTLHSLVALALLETDTLRRQNGNGAVMSVPLPQCGSVTDITTQLSSPPGGPGGDTTGNSTSPGCTWLLPALKRFKLFAFPIAATSKFSIAKQNYSASRLEVIASAGEN